MVMPGFMWVLYDKFMRAFVQPLCRLLMPKIMFLMRVSDFSLCWVYARHPYATNAPGFALCWVYATVFKYFLDKLL